MALSLNKAKCLFRKGTSFQINVSCEVFSVFLFFKSIVAYFSFMSLTTSSMSTFSSSDCVVLAWDCPIWIAACCRDVFTFFLLELINERDWNNSFSSSVRPCLMFYFTSQHPLKYQMWFVSYYCTWTYTQISKTDPKSPNTVKRSEWILDGLWSGPQASLWWDTT